MDNIEVSEVIRLSNKKTDKVCSLIKKGKFSNEMEEDIEFIFKCAFDKRKAVWEHCIDNLYKLAVISNVVCERMIKIMENGNIHEKFIITCSALAVKDRKFLKEILYRAIRDKSKKVKTFGAQRADDNNLYEFADIIKEEMEKTTDKKIKEQLERHYIFLTKGYIIDETYPESKRVYITWHYGYPLPKKSLTKDEIHEYIITEFKNNDRIKDLYYKK